jgi:hypothetical protein
VHSVLGPPTHAQAIIISSVWYQQVITNHFKKIHIEVMSTILFISVFGSRTNDTGMDGMSYSVSRQSGLAGSVLLIQFLGGGVSNSSGTTNSTNGKYCLSVSYK